MEFGGVVDSLSEFIWTEDHGDALFGLSVPGDRQDLRGALFEAYAVGLREAFPGLFDLPVHEAWALANEVVEGSGVEWACLRAAGETFVLTRGSC